VDASLPQPLPARRDPLSLTEWILAVAEQLAGNEGGHAAIGTAAALLAASDLPAALVERARLLAVGAYFDGRGDDLRGTANRLARAREALVPARRSRPTGRYFIHIGTVRSPWKSLEGMPLQTVAAEGSVGSVELAAELAVAARHLDGFSHIWLLTDLDRSSGYEAEVVPFLDDQPRGVLATRNPRRPNPIGLSLVRLISVVGPTLHVEELDLLDGTPVLDVKPYVPLFDAREASETGWFSEAAARVFDTRSDARYEGSADSPASPQAE
jgi:tRNA-Thr(GGU) m(6)t(6)A37 methyltransferase TsaA